MSEPKKRSPSNGGNSSGRKRNLPSWMSGRQEEETSVSASHSGAKDFSKIMEGIVFVLSGFVNPERGVLRSQALEMGAEYQPDWISGCTLLVCAFPNTPKFRQVEADTGTIVSKEWITECYNQRKLVEIEPYLMFAGKPWRQQSISLEANQDERPSSSRKSQKQVEQCANSKPTASTSSKKHMNDSFSPSRVKQWAIDDFRRTLSWLENQDEKPEKSEIKKVAAEGILTCLQDTIDTLKQGQVHRKSLQAITQQWACVPRVVEELAKLYGSRDNVDSVTKEDLCRQAMDCRQIYELQYSKLEDDSPAKKLSKSNRSGKGSNEEKVASRTDAAYDSDETVEMTEEEIDQAFDTIASILVDAG